MNENHPSDPRPAEAASEARLDRIEAVLAEQIARAKTGEYEAVAELGQRLAREIRENAAAPPRPANPQAKRIRDLHHKLNLILAEHRKDLADKIKRLRRGNRTLGAYRDNSGRR